LTVSQVKPLHCDVHAQKNELPVLKHCAPFLQGFCAQVTPIGAPLVVVVVVVVVIVGLGVLHIVPLHCDVQAQKKVLPVLKQVAPF